MPVYFTPEITAQLGQLEKRYPRLRDFITEVLAQDPRPAYRKEEEEGKTYAVWLLISTFAGASPGQVLKCLPLNPGNFVLLSFGIFATLVN